jgi:hypothetical protein
MKIDKTQPDEILDEMDIDHPGHRNENSKPSSFGTIMSLSSVLMQRFGSTLVGW